MLLIHDTLLPAWTSRLGVLVCPTVNIPLSASLVRSKVVHSTTFDVNVSAEVCYDDITAIATAL